MAEKEEQIGKDLKLKFDQIGADLVVLTEGDLETVAKDDNLAQAIIARLSTDEGELFDLGHADYGSRLHDVLGEVNNASTRQRIKTIVTECLAQETRIKEIIEINALPDPDDSHAVNIEISIIPINSTNFLTLSYPLHLEGAGE